MPPAEKRRAFKPIARSDTRYNSINSYAMLHVRYRLNMFGGKVDTEGRYDSKWGGRDRRRW